MNDSKAIETSMLNIFWIHSHVTFLMAREIILDMKDGEVIIFLSRGYQLPIDIGGHNIMVISFPWYRDGSAQGHNILIKSDILQTRQNVKLCKKEINRYVKNKEFTLFAPTSWEYSVALLMKHPLCRSYYYLEEGTLSYMENGHKERTSFMTKQICKYVYNLPYLGMLGILSNMAGTYATSKDAFPWSDKRKIIISWRKVDNYFSEYIGTDKIVIFDHLNMSEDVLKIFIDSLCDLLHEKKIVKFAYKFHPSTKEEANKENIVRNKLKIFDVCELPSDFIIELFIINQSITLYCVNSISSLSVYAGRLGSQSFLIQNHPSTNNMDMKKISF